MEDNVIKVTADLETARALLPPGAPKQGDEDVYEVVKAKLTPEDKVRLQGLQSIAYHLTVRKQGTLLYCLPDLVADLKETGLGGPGISQLYRFVAGNNHKIGGTEFRWRRLPMPHRDVETGRKWNVYELVDEAVEKAACACEWCPPRQL